MKCLSLALAAAFLVASPVWADDPAPDTKQADSTENQSPAEKLKADPNSTDALNAYMGDTLRKVMSLMDSDPDEAEELLNGMDELLGSLEPDAAPAKQLLARAVSAVTFYKARLELARLSLDTLAAGLKENPDDTNTISQYIAKVQQELSGIARTEPEKADEQLKAANELLASVKEKAETEEAKKACDGAEQAFSRLASTIATGMKLAALIGQDAASLANVEGWTNGTPLTDADLKGKVVLLDFWAIWCGPCVSTFPHLIEWHEKYADKGLVMIGLTRYYGYKWDEKIGKEARVRAPADQTPEQKQEAERLEQEAMAKYVEGKGLHHRIAFQKDRELSDFYAVTGIPHVVVVDREGKVRLIRVGSGEKNSQDIEAMIQELLAVAGAES